MKIQSEQSGSSNALVYGSSRMTTVYANVHACYLTLIYILGNIRTNQQ